METKILKGKFTEIMSHLEKHQNNEPVQKEDLKRTIGGAKIIYCVYTRSSASGLTRCYKVLAYDKETKQFWNIGHLLGRFLGYKYCKSEQVVKIYGYGFSAEDNITRKLSNWLYGADKKLRSQDL